MQRLHLKHVYEKKTRFYISDNVIFFFNNRKGPLHTLDFSNFLELDRGEQLKLLTPNRWMSATLS